MTFVPKSLRKEPNFLAQLSDISLIATDMDGTLTLEGRFTIALLDAWERLRQVGVEVLIVTGRSAGWVNALSHYFPIVGAIAENGGLYYPAGQEQPDFLVAIEAIPIHRQRLQQFFTQLQAEFPRLRESGDNAFRLTDWTFDVAGLSDAELTHLGDRCHQEGWSMTYSTVQVHIKLPQQDKADGLLTVLDRYFPGISPSRVVTVGDSPNDESLFDASRFPLSVGVANLAHYGDRLTHHPTVLTTRAEVNGFCELAEAIVQAKG
jgi:HAD superfamily hydrolase (TIGR01484 family)